MIWLAVACEAPTREVLADERRPVGEVRVGEAALRVSAALRGWRYGAGFGEDGPSLGRTSYFVSYEVEAPAAEASLQPGRVRGDADTTWELRDRDEAERAWAALSLESCSATDLAAYREVGPAGPATPWRVWIPDVAGGAAGLVETAPGTCEAALSWAGDAETWRAVRASHPGVCTHLAHLGRRDDAVRCLLREPPKGVGRHTSRQDLPGGADDPEFDDRVLRVLLETPPPGAARFVPYRVLDLTGEIRDRARVREAARVVASRPERALPWEAALVGATAATWIDEALARALVARLDQDDAAGVAATSLAAELLSPRFPDLARELRAAARAAEVPPAEPWLPPDYAPGPPCPAEHRLAPDRC